jgi:acyl-CoA synthetase (AMP-forming)/AMP-acid ligase II
MKLIRIPLSKDATPPNARLLHHTVHYQAERIPSKPALIFEDRTITWSELNHRAIQLAHGLMGIGKTGSRVAVISENRPEMIECLYGIPAAGMIAALINYRLHPKEQMKLLESANPTIVIIEKQFLGKLRKHLDNLSSLKHLIVLGDASKGSVSYEQLTQGKHRSYPKLAKPNDTAWIIYTSGTTGLPKGVMLSHRGLLTSISQAVVDTAKGILDRSLICLPLFHVANVSAMVTHFAGAAVVLEKTFEPKSFLRTIEKQKVTYAIIVPIMGVALLRSPSANNYNLKSLRVINYTGDRMSPLLLAGLVKQFGTILRIGGQYGMTELSGGVLRVSPKDVRRFYFLIKLLPKKVRHLVQSSGQPYPGVHLKIVDGSGKEAKTGEAGELVVKSKQVMQGYWRNANATRETVRDGWLHTGDLAKRDDKGYYYILDRKKDMVITGGENVFPLEVESVLNKHPAVLESSVIGLPDEQWGELLTAVVVLKKRKKTSEQALKKFVRKELAGYKTPKRVIFAQELPRSTTGKVLKRQLREAFVKHA